MSQEDSFLCSRKLNPNTIDQFGLGDCARGCLGGRITIPLHDEFGELVGYANNLADDTRGEMKEPQYKLPAFRLRGQQFRESRKSLLLYNVHRLNPPVENLVVVQGFASVWWLWQNGHQNSVALLGTRCSLEQAELIKRIVHSEGRLWVFCDSDDAGERCSKRMLALLSPHRFVRWIRGKRGTQPADWSAADLSLAFV